VGVRRNALEKLPFTSIAAKRRIDSIPRRIPSHADSQCSGVRPIRSHRHSARLESANGRARRRGDFCGDRAAAALFDTTASLGYRPDPQRHGHTDRDRPRGELVDPPRGQRTRSTCAALTQVATGSRGQSSQLRETFTYNLDACSGIHATALTILLECLLISPPLFRRGWMRAGLTASSNQWTDDTSTVGRSRYSGASLNSRGGADGHR
jgi:hypothetical protein